MTDTAPPKTREVARLHCDYTGHECGTDTVAPGRICIGTATERLCCGSCERWAADLIERLSPDNVAVDRCESDVVAGALFDFLGALTTSDGIIVGSKHTPHAALDLLRSWATSRGLDIDKADVKGWRERLSQPAEPSAVDAERLRPVVHEAQCHGLPSAADGYKETCLRPGVVYLEGEPRCADHALTMLMRAAREAESEGER